jgi:hypothetical protein
MIEMRITGTDRTTGLTSVNWRCSGGGGGGAPPENVCYFEPLEA